MMDGQREPIKPRDDTEQQPGSLSVPGAASGSSRRTLLLTIAVFLCVVAAGVSAAVFSSPGGGQAGSIAGPESGSSQAGHTTGTGNRPTAKARSAQPTAPHASSRVVTGPDVTSNGTADSALRWPPRLERQILRWLAGPGGFSLDSVETHMGNAMQTAGLKLYSPMRLACVSLASDIGTAQAGPPIPYDAMQRLYARALDGLSGAAADCRTAISVDANGDESVHIHVDKVLLNRSRAEFAAMSSKLYTATAQIQSLSR
jgi:hypothetical protein